MEYFSLKKPVNAVDRVALATRISKQHMAMLDAMVKASDYSKQELIEKMIEYCSRNARTPETRNAEN